MINSERLCRAVSVKNSNAHGDTASCTAVKNLEAGDNVYVKLNAGGLFKGDFEKPDTGFMGVRLQ